MKKNIKIAAGLAVTAAVLSGCAVGGANTGGDGQSGEVVELTFLTAETPNLDAEFWDAAVERASAEVPGVKINRIVSPTADRASYAKQLAGAGQMPDIMAGVNPQGFAQAGQLAEWSVDELSGYSFPESNTIDGKIYQLPQNAQPQSLVYYNEDAFATAGIEAPPATWNEFLEACEKLKAAGITPIEVGGGGQDTWASLYTWMGTVGTDVYLDDPDFLTKVAEEKATFSDEEFLAATRKVEELSKLGYIDQDGLSRSYADTELAFRDGKAAMYPMGSWFSASADNDPPAFGVGVFAWPSDGGEAVVPTYTGGGLSVSSSAKDVELAKKWALAFEANADNNDAIVKADGAIIAMPGYEAPSDMGPVYTAAVGVFQAAVESGGVTPAFTVESGDGALPADVTPQVAGLSVELLSGRASAADTVAQLDTLYKSATAR